MDLNNLRMSHTQEYKFQKILLPSTISRSKVFVSVLAALILGILRLLQFLRIFLKIQKVFHLKSIPRLLTHNKVSLDEI